MYQHRLTPELDDESLKIGASFYLPKQKVEKKKSSTSESSSSTSESESDSDQDSSDEEFYDENQKPLSPHLSAPANRLGSGKKKSALSLFSVNESSTKKKQSPAKNAIDTSFDDIDIAATYIEEDGAGDDSDDDSNEGSEDGDKVNAAFSTSFSKKEAEVIKKSKPTSDSNNMTSTPSFVKSMNEYAVRRQLVVEKVGAGSVQAEHEFDARHVTQQADLEMYTEESQIKRSQIKRSPLFQAEAKKLWNLVGSEDGTLNKSQYTKMITKICRLIIPPPIDKADLLQTAMDDWEKDLCWAREHGLVEEKAQELNYDAFFKSIYELVDTWTATALEQEYIDMMKRLNDGVAVEFQGNLRWKQDENIEFDSYFSFRTENSQTEEDTGASEKKVEEKEKSRAAVKMSEKVNKNEVDTSKEKDPLDKLLIEQEELNGPSILEPMGLPDETAKKKKRKSKNKEKELPLLSVPKVYARIAKIYQLKQQADLWATTSAVAKPIRFDKFVLRCFMQEYGTRKIARRHLRHFITSAQRHLLKGGGETYPRIYLFLVISGVVTLPPSDEFNPRLAAEYFLPALRFVFTNARTITDLLGDGTGQGCMILKQVIERSAIPLNLRSVLGGPFAIKNFKQKLKDLTVEASQGQGGNMVNLDKALYLSLDLWRFSDTLRMLRERAALKTVQRFLKMKAKEKLEREAASLKLEDSLTGGGGSSNEVIQLKDGDKSEVTMPSPRVAEKLSQARELDKILNDMTMEIEPTPEKSLKSSEKDGNKEDSDGDKTESDAGKSLQSSVTVVNSASAAAGEGKGEASPLGDAVCDSEVEALLVSLGLEKFIDKFAAEEVTMSMLKNMSEFELAEMHVSKGARVKIRAKVAAM